MRSEAVSDVADDEGAWERNVLHAELNLSIIKAGFIINEPIVV